MIKMMPLLFVFMCIGPAFAFADTEYKITCAIGKDTDLFFYRATFTKKMITFNEVDLYANQTVKSFERLSPIHLIIKSNNGGSYADIRINATTNGNDLSPGEYSATADLYLVDYNIRMQGESVPCSAIVY